MRGRRRSGLLAILLVSAAACRARAVVVTRGPYLQTGTPTSVVVCWRTDAPSGSFVRYGTTAEALTLTRSDLSSVRDHAVTLTGLDPATSYFYSVGTATDTLSGGTTCRFTTAPAPGTPASFRFWVIGDSGTGDASARAVRDAYEAQSAGRDTAFWIMLGDDAYNAGTDGEFQKAVFETYSVLLRRSVLWSAFGNHDGSSASASTNTGPYFDAFVFPKNGEAGGDPSGTEAYFSFDFAGAHFISLDSYGSSRQAGSPMLTWLAGDLAKASGSWTIAFWHHTPYTKGSHDSDTEVELVEMRRNVLPLLEAAGVDLVLCGHSHDYERSFLLDGHYGTSDTLAPSMVRDRGDGRPSGTGAYHKPPGRVPHAGAVYAVVGSSARLGGGRLNHPAMCVSRNVLGSLVVDVSDDRLDALFLRETGEAGDSFSIVKSRHRAVPPRAAPPEAPPRRRSGPPGP